MNNKKYYVKNNGKNNKDSYRKKFTNDIVNKQTFDLYKKIISVKKK